MIKILTTLLLFVFAINISNACVITVSATSSHICIGKKDTLSVTGATTYTWMPGNINTSTFTVQPSATTIYTVYSAGTAGCLDTSFVTVAVDSLPTTVAVNALNSSVCQGISPILTASGAATYSWMPGAFTGNPYNALPNTNTIYTITGATAQGCTKTTTININVTAAPKPILQDSFANATFGTSFSNCNNLSGSPIYSITVTSPANATITSYSINWGNGGGTINGITAASFPLHYTYPNFGIYNLIFTAHYANGCSRDSIIQVINQTNPAIGISNVSGNTSGCGPIGYWFQMSNYQANATGTYYVWDFGDGTPTVNWTTVTTDSIFHMFTTSSCGFPNNEFTVSITAINSCSFTKATVSSIKVFKKPEANFTTNVTNTCAGTPITFSNMSVLSQNAPNCNNNSNWNWNFGDGSPNESTANVTHTYNNAGTYTVTLIAIGGCGADTMQAPICIVENIVNFNSNIASLCAPASIALNNTSPTSINCTVTPYTWSITNLSNTCPGDSSANFIYLTGNSTSATPNIIINNQGTYRIRLTHTNSCGTIFKDTIITISRKPNASITSVATLCSGEMLYPIANVTNCGTAPITYLWNAASATPSSSNNTTPSFLFPAGTHTFSVTATNECGSNVVNKNITIHPLPLLNFSANPGSTICAGTGVLLSAYGAYTYNWAGGTLSGTGFSKVFTANTTTTYTITGTNSFGCSSTTSITINVNPNPIITASNTIPTCVPGNDATITITAIGGTPTYSYQLNGGSIGSSPIFPSLGVGTYTCTVADLNTCTASIIKNIITPNAPNIVSITTTNVSCNGLNNGVIQLNTSGGTGALQYVLQPGNTNGNGTFTNLSANMYTIVVTDANGCSTFTSITITQPSALSWVNISANAANCFGTNTGSISATANGGTLNYSYLLTPTGQTNSSGNFTSKTAGNYTITLTDAKGCTISTTTPITQPPALIWDSVDKINLKCANIAEGEIHAYAIGGSGTIQYAINPSGNNNTTGNFINLSASNYTVYATDGNGCILSTIVTITQPTALQIVNISIVSPSCNPGGDGSLTVNATGGTPAYSYQLNGGSLGSSPIFSSLGIGTYSCTVVDLNNCTTSILKNIITPNAPSIVSIAATNVSCNGLNNGSIQLNSNGGSGALQYVLQPGNINGNGTFTNLYPNTYTIVVTDANGCSTFTSITITQPSALSWVNISANAANCFGTNTGSITATANGGTLNYSYLLTPTGQTNSNGNFTNKTAGIYTVTLVDAKGCTISATTTITQPNALIWDSLDKINLKCVNIAEGEIHAYAIGGSGTIQYAINPSGTNNTTGNFINLSASNYTVYATDGNGCVLSTIVNITQPPALQILNISGANPSCNPGGDGTITVNATGGIGSITYQLNTNAVTSNNIFNNLSSGIYTITIIDSNGCTSASVKSLITPNSPIFNSTSKINVTCNAQNNGSISVNASSMNSAISYTLMPGNITNTTGNFASLHANIYTITATDNIGCNTQTIVTITQPLPLTWASATIIPASCFGSFDGSINSQATGGTGIYTYSLLPSNVINTTGLFTNLPASNYTINCIDAKGCSISTSLQITQAPTLNISSLSTTNVSCFGLNNGSINVSTVGGNGTISFSTNPATSTVTNGLLANLAVSNYTVIATDANGCTKTSTTIITQPNAISWTNFLKTSPSCIPGNDGSMQFAISGGTPNYSYLLNGLASTNNISNLASGIYTLVVTDANNCTTNSIVNINTPNNPIIDSLHAQNISCHNLSNGSAQLFVSGGIGFKTFTLMPNNISNSIGNFNNLTAYTYTIQCMDSLGCKVQQIVSIANPPSVSFLSVSTTPITCVGLSNASVVGLASGGTGILTYQILPTISPANNSGVFANLYAANYTLSVHDINGCTKDSTFIILPAAPVSGSYIVQQNVSCNGGNNGAITTFANSGKPPFMFYLLGSTQVNNTGIFSGLSAGTYTIQIVDSALCNASISPIIITQPNAITFAPISPIAISCFGNSTNALQVTANGGTGAMQYTISPLGPQNNTTGNFVQLFAGNYTIQAIDANLCTSTVVTSITQAAPIIITTLNPINPICNGDKNGAIQLAANGGTGNLIYQINATGFINNPNFTGLGAGTYTIQIKDANGCLKDTIINLYENNKVSIDTLHSSDVICENAMDGQIYLHSNGINNFYGILPDSITNAFGFFPGLAAGTYTVFVKNDSGCSAESVVTINPAFNPLQLSISKQDLDCIGNGYDGWAQANPIGGAQPYTYLWSTAPIQTSQKAETLSYGYYIVEVTDFKNCKINDTIYIEPGNCCEEIYFPNAFTPNADGVNDVFKPITNTGRELIVFAIFNRYGQEVWHANTIEDAWKGLDFNTTNNETGTYYYIYSYKCLHDGKKYSYKGDVSLIR